MGAGKYRHRITIQNPSPETPRNSFGERTTTGADVCTVWADRVDLNGTEFVEARSEQANVTARFDIRFRTDIQPKMIVIEQSIQYDIQSVIDAHGLHKELQLLCTRKENQ